ncbi:hypothetical protein GCM10020358_75840 [Amorphoplanes nipponensis]|uniref:G5 domain-containing protein n=1 Tax=Actinoplanes nipponensis TaxID=135950 RepID=A0A919JFZ9_9ACTN|nr:G5 domain-containing protein [Actinoplanes nipponensis]GIE50053.1 hypothetical protein Ani05nite_35870 [Actinoplanes nipponensis]
MPHKSPWARLPFGVRMATAGLGVLALVAGTAAGIAALTSEDTRVVTTAGQGAPVAGRPAAEVPPSLPAGATGLGNGAVAPDHGAPGHTQAEREADETRSAPGQADRTATRSPRRPTAPGPVAGGPTAPGPVAGGPVKAGPVKGGAVVPVPGAAAVAVPPAAGAPAAPQVRTEQVSETEAIPFGTKLVPDPSLPPGAREIETPGVPGERLLRYEVTYTGNRETSRRLLDSKVTREPQDRIVAFGDRQRGDRPGGGKHQGGRGHRECRPLKSCVWLGRDRDCPDDGTGAPGEGVIDGDLSLLDPSDIDELDLVLPCEGDPDDQPDPDDQLDPDDPDDWPAGE